MYLIRIVKFYRNRKKQLFNLVGRTEGKKLLKAIKRNQGIMISERNADVPIDGNLYSVLKGLGAKSVRNAIIDIENNGKLSGVYVTYFNEIKP